MSNRHGIGFAKDTLNNIETDCHTCMHRCLCFRLKVIQEIELPVPYEITFVCRQFKKESEADTELVDALKTAIGMLDLRECLNSNCIGGVIETFHHAEPQHEQCQWCCQMGRIKETLAKKEKSND